MTNTTNRARNASNDPANTITDGAYARSSHVCRYCGIVADTREKANGTCEATGRRHFLVAAE